ncbi:MAG TPA: hypothetical protein K8U77_06200 [Slackia equolifaciens]|uniref:Uncharacterized protein n=1 Tax=Slackia equolifaciens TaxID=498718 RepID=A0A9D2UWM6_9ACTN|nr:hypothetical protein [Slackia equolifaciens]
MLAKADLVRIALRYDTSMSRAMLRACGVFAREPWPKEPVKVSVDRYDGMRACFANFGSPMDGRAG